jgi:hypothetical protein
MGSATQRAGWWPECAAGWEHWGAFGRLNIPNKPENKFRFSTMLGGFAVRYGKCFRKGTDSWSFSLAAPTPQNQGWLKSEIGPEWFC